MKRYDHTRRAGLSWLRLRMHCPLRSFGSFYFKSSPFPSPWTSAMDRNAESPEYLLADSFPVEDLNLLFLVGRPPPVEFESYLLKNLACPLLV